MAGSRTKPAFWKAYYPPRNLELMPKRINDFHRKIKDVPQEYLY